MEIVIIMLTSQSHTHTHMYAQTQTHKLNTTIRFILPSARNQNGSSDL